MKKHIIFGGFDYAVLYEMSHDAVYRGIDYFVDNDIELIGKTYMGKPIYAPEQLLKEDKDNVIILIGSIIYLTEIRFQLQDMGFEYEKHFIWAINFQGDEKCPRLWHKHEWNDREKNKESLNSIEQGQETLQRLRIVSRLIDFNKIDTIVDLCAANGRIKEFLPTETRYVPVDYIKYSDETVVMDLNNNEFPHNGTNGLQYNPQTTSFLLVGSMQCVAGWRGFLKNITQNCVSIIIAHNDFARINREYRRTNRSSNVCLFNHEIILELQKNDFIMTDAHDFHLRTVIMKFEKAEKR